VTSTPVALSIVIPAFNESGRIAQTIADLSASLPRLAPDYEIRVVDDGSTDDTATIVEQLACTDRRVVLQRERHGGKGSAVRAGLLAARGELRFMCDADLSMPVGEMVRFLALVPSHCDVAIGSREGLGARRIGEPSYRHVLGRAFNALVKALGLPRFNDTQCGFKLFTSRAVNTIFPLTTITGWAFDVEVLFIARLRALRVMEIPIEWHYRELSRVSPVRDPLGMIRDLFRIRLNVLRGAYRE
jgi:dolichyl-phosphate beta-glucosyltransferase